MYVFRNKNNKIILNIKMHKCSAKKQKKINCNFTLNIEKSGVILDDLFFGWMKNNLHKSGYSSFASTSRPQPFYTRCGADHQQYKNTPNSAFVRSVELHWHHTALVLYVLPFPVAYHLTGRVGLTFPSAQTMDIFHVFNNLIYSELDKYNHCWNR